MLTRNVTSDRGKLELLQRVRNDPWEFSKYVFTLDEADKVTPKKRFPYELPYIKLYMRLWVKENRIAVPKSRRMKMTWVNLVLILWDTMFHEGRHNGVVSKKEDDADFLLQNRIKFMLENLDPALPRELLPQWESIYCKISFPEINSKIQGFPQGKDQLRQYTLSNIFADEFAFWDKAQETYSASLPTLEGGGRFIGISSPEDGFFKRLCFDQLEEKGLTNEREAMSIEKRHPIEGVEIWRNKQNQFVVFQLHYTADPRKRTQAFKEGARKGMPLKDYLKEYELIWETHSGFPVYSDFHSPTHVSKAKLDPWLGLPLIRGWDFGLTPACIVAQMQDRKLVVLKEFVAVNMGIDKFSDIVLEGCAVLFPEWGNQKDWLDFVDPSGFFRKDTDEKTCAGIMSDKGIRPEPGPITFEDRKNAVEKFLTTTYKGEPCFVLNEEECPVLKKGFEGGYQYPEKMIEIEPGKIRPVKNEYSHPHDALQMIAAKIKVITAEKRRSIPKPAYSFSSSGKPVKEGMYGSIRYR